MSVKGLDNMKPIKLIAASLAALTLTFGSAHAAGGDGKTVDYDFSFEGPFGTYDTMQLQRGLAIYHNICSSCHGLELVYFRNLTEQTGPDMPEDMITELASNYFIPDDGLEAQPGDERPAGLSDQFPGSALSNAPDMSLLAKARAGFHGPYGTGMSQLFRGMGGAEYIASVLTGYTGEEKEEGGTIFYENTAFPGGWIAMAPPLWGEDIEHADGAPNDLESEAQDVAAFLMWAAEPKLNQRKAFGLTAVILLSIMAGLLYFTNKKLWYDVKHPKA
ncbi:Cytochrome c1 [Pontivivens insulae]|uniref:Cytochrome c1 n=2 Tax=Pontivivens insulae TaxID=1639689 RepID=A0A2R8AD69_9RHOB|nr:ubiquinol-cytochrome c reductase cytochrome c1 subunit [Pontivivens insulae]SPF30186.1 Cytochrome c1 [Pontivivens insulae]